MYNDQIRNIQQYHCHVNRLHINYKHQYEYAENTFIVSLIVLTIEDFERAEQTLQAATKGLDPPDIHKLASTDDMSVG